MRRCVGEGERTARRRDLRIHATNLVHDTDGKGTQPGIRLDIRRVEAVLSNGQEDGENGRIFLQDLIGCVTGLESGNGLIQHVVQENGVDGGLIEIDRTVCSVHIAQGENDTGEDLSMLPLVKGLIVVLTRGARRCTHGIERLGLGITGRTMCGTVILRGRFGGPDEPRIHTGTRGGRCLNTPHFGLASSRAEHPIASGVIRPRLDAYAAGLGAPSTITRPHGEIIVCALGLTRALGRRSTSTPRLPHALHDLWVVRRACTRRGVGEDAARLVLGGGRTQWRPMGATVHHHPHTGGRASVIESTCNLTLRRRQGAVDAHGHLKTRRVLQVAHTLGTGLVTIAHRLARVECHWTLLQRIH